MPHRKTISRHPEPRVSNVNSSPRALVGEMHLITREEAGEEAARSVAAYHQ